MISRPNSMAHPVAYVEVLIIPLSIARRTQYKQYNGKDEHKSPPTTTR